MTKTVANTVAASLALSVGTAAASAVGGSAGSAAGGASGGTITPILFGVQRLSLSSGLAVEMSDAYRSALASLAVFAGDLEFLSSTKSMRRRRKLSNKITASRNETDEKSVSAELVLLYNQLIACAVAVACAVVIEFFLVLIWRHFMNCRYYKQQSATGVKLDTAETGKAVQFVPFPKSFMWPTPLFFALFVCTTGLARSSTRLLAASPPDCTFGCLALAIVVLSLLVTFMGVIILVTTRFFWRHGQDVQWKTASKHDLPKSIADPYMRLRAKMSVEAAGLRLLAKNALKRKSAAVHPGHLSCRPRTSVQDAALEGEASKAHFTSALPRRTSMKDARAHAIVVLASKGHRDRKSGVWTIPEADVAEPARTERILARPFALYSDRAGETWQKLEGFLFFRVNGARRVTMCYRPLVLIANMSFGILSGLQPLLAEGSTEATVQICTIVSLQLTMSAVCFCCLPDADRIISRFAGAQFLCEGLATSLLLVASYDTGINSADLRIAGFFISLVAVAVPIAQLLEQRLITPTIGLIQTGGCKPTVLCAQLYMLLTSLPLKLAKLISTGEAGGASAASSANSASADSGDDNMDEADDDGTESQGQEKEAAPALSAGAGTLAGLKVSRLLGRALAAKEAAGKKIPARQGKKVPAGQGAPPAEGPDQQGPSWRVVDVT